MSFHMLTITKGHPVNENTYLHETKMNNRSALLQVLLFSLLSKPYM